MSRLSFLFLVPFVMATTLLLLLGLVSIGSEDHPTAKAASTIDEPRFEVIVLGRAQDGGLPHLGCERGCCVMARRTGRLETPACLGVRDLETGAGRVLAGGGGLVALLGTALFHWLVHRAPYPDDD